MVHNHSKYWIAIKANLFRDRAYFPQFSPPKATSIQWGYVDTSTGASRDPVTFAISFTTTPGLAWTTNYATTRCTHAVSLTGFDTTINYDKADAKVWYIAIGS